MAEPSRTSVTGWRKVIAQLIGLPTMPSQVMQGGREVDVRDAYGGHVAPPVTSQTRWILSDLENAVHQADTGDLTTAARLCRAMRRDGVYSGVLSTRTDGLVRLPVRWSGREDMVKAFEGRDRKRGLFATMFPSTELALLAKDGIDLGAGVAEMLPIRVPEEHRPIGWVMRRLDPEWLRYRWNEDRWYYNSFAGPLHIQPGVKRADGGWWILHTPGGATAPWLHGNWPSLGRAWIAKEHAMLYRDNYSAKLAQAARAAYSPEAATEDQRRGMLSKLIAWGVNQVFDLPPGWDVKLIESNGRGYEVYAQTIDTSNEEFVVSIAGQTVTTDGGSGFANAEIHKTIRADLIQATADGLALTVNEQGILPYVNEVYGGGALDEAPWMEWDTSPPKELKAQADSLAAAGLAIRSLNMALQPYGHRVDVHELVTRFGIPITGDEQPVVQPRESSPEGAEDVGPADDAGADIKSPDVPTAQTATRSIVELVFDRDEWEPAEARTWARQRKFHAEAVRAGDNEIAIELVPAAEVDAGTLRHVDLGDGVVAVFGMRVERRLAAEAPAGARVRDYAGIKVVIDRPKGFHQRGTSPDGDEWERVYQVDYGYLAGTRGGDGEELDAFCGPDRWAPAAYVAIQEDEDGRFDEYKLFLGFASASAARACYVAHTPERLLRSVFEVPVDMIRAMLGLEPRARGEAIRMLAADADLERRAA